MILHTSCISHVELHKSGIFGSCQGFKRAIARTIFEAASSPADMALDSLVRKSGRKYCFLSVFPQTRSELGGSSYLKTGPLQGYALLGALGWLAPSSAE